MRDMVIAAGGAYIRIWRRGQGLLAEVPAAGVVDSEGAIVAVGEEAIGREGKLPPRQSFIRPFFADRIVHRDLLREVLRLALDQAQTKGKWWDRWRVTLLVPPSVPPLHAAWLERTVREAGAGLIERQDPLASLVKAQTRRVKGAPVMGVLDWGFSQVRAGIYAGAEPLAMAGAPHLSVAQLCEQVVSAERTASKRLFPRAGLYGLQWGLTHVAFDESSGRPAAGTLKPDVVLAVRQSFSDAILRIMADLAQKLPPEQAALLRQQGWIVVGGGAGLAGEPEDWARTLGVPVRIAANASYALLQGAEG